MNPSFTAHFSRDVRDLVELNNAQLRGGNFKREELRSLSIGQEFDEFLSESDNVSKIMEIADVYYLVHSCEHITPDHFEDDMHMIMDMLDEMWHRNYGGLNVSNIKDVTLIKYNFRMKYGKDHVKERRLVVQYLEEQGF